MNQNRVMLIVAWLVVAALLWMQWGKETNTPANVQVQTSSERILSHDPDEVKGASFAATHIAIPEAALSRNSLPMGSASNDGVDQLVHVETDVLQLTLDGRKVSTARLRHFPQTLDKGSPPVSLLMDDANHPYDVVAGWASESGSPVPGRGGFEPEKPQTKYKLADGQTQLDVPFIWKSNNGVVIRRVYSFYRNRYAISVRDEVKNLGDRVWDGYIFRKLSRVPAEPDRSVSNPDSFSFNGVVWYSQEKGYERRAFKDYRDTGNLNSAITGGWIAFLQHHFFTAWIPQANQTAVYVLSQDGLRDVAELRGPQFHVSPGQTVTTQARLWLGPKLVDAIAREQVKGLNRVVDYSRFDVMALIGQGLFWILSHMYGLFHNWGWSIIALVVLLRIAMYPLTAAQYRSAAKMRQFQPRLQQLKERYGEDRQKLQMAMMELYRKEKINPMGGCLPLLIQMPIFFSLYWVLVESVELRQAPWLGWIQNLTARDPYFVLPLLNLVIMWATQKLTPTPPGVDPMSARMMQFMPLVFGVMMAFVPSGLALYWVVNGLLNLSIQWLMMRRHGESAKGIIRIGRS